MNLNKSKSKYPIQCPARGVLNLLKGKFTIEILNEIMKGNIHYGGLLREILNVNPRILSLRLRTFEKEGILKRKVLNTSPPQVEYHLTKKGYDLIPIIEEMKIWAEKYKKL
ncbi:helix-turn-helix domain-containing protein [Staphylococcus caprae]|uniref:winged helix-turn-helix transcriptional regulator n=1 Tax=Staphylococcus caprae TaxID=29380 RepID=UPI000E6992CA|nr:helix-turn-helix domain-containing protein [Staphylococcus caprae]MBU5271850.1 helix-turn-helix transcriptional regulator [Staphylococcus caprae]MDK6296460.1 helix-turn-helix domain-containing protein [Staphylococcus caprae]MDK7231763.1 helix-turn-helix domain-containing protein [Staphylococcus caprae]RIM34599.1 transcriptional regulator [Staphylococcus caprae]